MATCTILNALADLLGIPFQPTDQKQTARSVATASGTLHVMDRPSFETALLIVEVAIVPARQRETITGVLEKACRKTKSGSPAAQLNPFTGSLSVWLEVPREAEAHQLENCLLQLFTFADCWRQELRKIAATEGLAELSPQAQLCVLRDASRRLVKLQAAA
ncbi:MAG: hypothetical protein ACAI35_21000 [Candidatus Methylacidiphilales bacterium]|nr:hypothetical protein [Candidatus Methylacidiphilales bacterium]